jgi:hypothetical protein
VASAARSPALTTWYTVNPDAWVTGVVPSAPRVTVHVVPETLVTSISSEVAAGSATWNWYTPVAAAGNSAEDATVNVSDVSAAGASVPPDETVVYALLANRL